MGFDPAPLLVDLFLNCYKSSWIRQLTKLDIRHIRRCVDVFRFIDDLTVINDEGEEGDILQRFTVLRAVSKIQVIQRDSFLIQELKQSKINLLFSFMIKEMISYFQQLESHTLLVTLSLEYFVLHLDKSYSVQFKLQVNVYQFAKQLRI